MNLINIFSTPIYFNNIKLEKNHISELLNEKYERIKINNGFATTSKYVLNNKKLLNLKKEIIKNFNEYAYNFLHIKKHIKFKILNSWCTKHSYNDWSQTHHHENSLISGILYLKTFENSGDLILHRNPFLCLFPSTVKIEFDKYTLNNSESFHIKPKQGDLIFFPSNLQHSVTKNLNKEDRYCCAFNLFPYGKFGSNENYNFMELK